MMINDRYECLSWYVFTQLGKRVKDRTGSLIKTQDLLDEF